MTMGRNDYDQTAAGTYDYANQLVENAEVYGADGEKVGHLVEAGPSYLLVQKGWLFIKDLYLPMSSIARVEADRVYLSYTKAQAEQVGRENLPTEGDAWYGSAPRTAGYATDYGTDREVGRTVRDNENITVPVVEEQLKAGVRETEAGRARVVKDVRQEQQSIDVPVEHEEIYVTERAVDRPATAADLSMRDRDIEIPLREQEVVTQKEARVTGEVNVRKEVRRETERVTDTVRREDVHVEGANTGPRHTEGDLTADQRRRFDAMSGEDQTRYGRMTAAERTRYDAENPWHPTDTAYDRTGMAGDRYDTTGTGRRDGEGIIDRAKDALNDRENRTR